MNKKETKKILTEIAEQCLGIPTLEPRGRDCQDFYENSVWSIKDALEQAYNRGRKQSASEKNKS